MPLRLKYLPSWCLECKLISRLSVQNAASKIFRVEIQLLLICLTLFLLRVQSFDILVHDWDESAYLVNSQNWLKGLIPYKDLFDNKGPVLYLLFSIVIALFDIDIFALRVFTTIYLMISVIAVFFTVKELTNNRYCGILGALVFAYFFDGKYGSFASNAEIFMLLPTILSVLFTIKSYFLFGRSDPKSRLIFSALGGFFACMSLLTKPSAVLTLALVPMFLVVYQIIKINFKISKKIVNFCIFYFIGFCMLLVPFVIYYYVHNALSDFIYMHFVHHANYIVASNDLKESLKILLGHMQRAGIPLLLAMCLLMPMLYRIKKYKKEQDIIILIIFFTSVFAVWVGRNPYPHYYQAMALPLAIILGSSVWYLPVNTEKQKKITFCIILMLLFKGILFLRLPISPTFLQTSISREAGEYLIKVSDYIKKNSTKEDTMYVYGHQPLIYVLSDRVPSTKYFIWFNNFEQYYNKSLTTSEIATILLKSAPDLFVLSLHNHVSYALKQSLDKTYAKLNFVEPGVSIPTYGGMSSVIIYKKRDI